MKKTLIFIIKIYQKIISPFARGRCRFHPSCSSYSVSAIDRHGAMKGLVLSAKRVMKCNPFHSGGYDPVP